MALARAVKGGKYKKTPTLKADVKSIAKES